MTAEEFNTIYSEEIAKRDLWEKTQPRLFEQMRQRRAEFDGKAINERNTMPANITTTPSTSNSLAALALARVAQDKAMNAKTPTQRAAEAKSALAWVAASARNGVLPASRSKPVPPAPTGYISKIPDWGTTLSSEDITVSPGAVQRFCMLAHRVVDLHNIDVAIKNPTTPEHIREGLGRLAEAALTSDTAARSQVMFAHGKAMSAARNWLAREVAAAA
jgi:hypothetical protein